MKTRWKFMLLAMTMMPLASPVSVSGQNIIPGNIKTVGGQQTPVAPTAIVIAPAGGAGGPGQIVASDYPFPITCITGCSGGGGGSSNTAATTPFSVTAGVNKPWGISTFNSAGFFVPVKPGTTTEIDLSGPAGLVGADGTSIMGPSNPLNALLGPGSSIVGKISQVDSSGVDATDTTNHAVKVNIVAGASSGAVAQGSTTSGQNGGLVQGAVTTAAPIYTTATTNPLSLTTSGGLRVDGSATTQPVSGTVTVTQSTAANLVASVVGTVAAGSADAGNPVKVGGRYNSTNPTMSDGQRGDFPLNSRGMVRAAISGIGLTANDGRGNVAIFAQDEGNGGQELAVLGYLKGASSLHDTARAILGSFGSGTGVTAVEHAGNPSSNITTATTTTIKSGAGILHTINIGLCVAAATITIYDNTAASGTKLGTITCPSVVGDVPTKTYDIAFATGLTVVTSAATDVTVGWR